MDDPIDRNNSRKSIRRRENGVPLITFCAEEGSPVWLGVWEPQQTTQRKERMEGGRRRFFLAVNLYTGKLVSKKKNERMNN